MRTLLALALAAAAPCACRVTDSPRWADVIIIYDFGCDHGCDEIEPGDWLQTVDGDVVTRAETLDVRRIADGQPHVLGLQSAGTREPKRVEIVAHLRNDLPPLVDVPPFWTATAHTLDLAPDWARGSMFAHASPIVQLQTEGGEVIDGRQLLGRKRLMVYWHRNDERAASTAATFMQVLQRAREDLSAEYVEIMFVHAPFPGAENEPIAATELIAWRDASSLDDMPRIPVFHRPSTQELDPSREIGMELDFAVMDHLEQSPAIVLLDARGIVRWHSEGLATPPGDAMVRKADQYTIIEAVKFALAHL